MTLSPYSATWRNDAVEAIDEVDTAVDGLAADVATLLDGGPFIVDKTRPLEYYNFYRANGNDHTAALQAIVDAIFTESGDYRRYFDGQGARAIIDEPIVITGSGNALRSFANLEVLPSGSWVGNYLFDATAAAPGDLRLFNVTLIGGHVANWFDFDNFDLHLIGGSLRNNKTDETPGIKSRVNSHLNMLGVRALVNDGSLLPSARSRVCFDCDNGDNKIFDSTFAFFKHAGLFRGNTNHLGSVHVFQGQSGGTDTPSHTAGFKFGLGKSGSIIDGLYLDKCFIEMSNEYNATATAIGGLTISDVKTLLNSGDSAFAYFVAKDYHAQTGLAIEDVRITGGEYVNFGSTQAGLTKLDPAGSFDRTMFDGVRVGDNTFAGTIAPQANPITLSKNFASATQHPFVMTGLMPFQARPVHCLSIVGRPNSADSQALYVGNINLATDTVRIDSASAWPAGSIIVTVTSNQSVDDVMIE